MGTSRYKYYPDEIVAKIQEDTGLTKTQVKEILDSQFRFVSNMIKKGNTRGVKLMRFGRFNPKPGKVEVLKDRVIKRKNGEL